MSDGNFNRNLLPYNSYQSGFRAGHSRMRQQALEAFISLLNEEIGNIFTSKEKENITTKFQSRLSKFTP